MLIRRSPSSLRAARLLAALVAGLLLLQPVAVGAQSSDDKKQQLESQIGEISAQEAAALQQLQAIREQKAAVDARVADLDARVGAAEAALAGLEAEVLRLTASSLALVDRASRAQAKLDAAQDELDLSAAELYRAALDGSQYDSLLATTPDEVATSQQYLDNVASKRRRVVERVARLRDQIEAQRQAAEAQKDQADASAAEAESQRDQLARLRAEVEPARAQAAQQQAAEEQALAAIQLQKASYEADLQSLEAASAAIAAQLSSGGGGAARPCEARPVPGAVRSGYGPRTHPVYGTTRMHTGLDMAGSSGEPIRSCLDGTVVMAGWNGGYGNTVVVDHGGGMATLYAHQSSVAVSVGAQITSGAVIGYVGSTGVSTGPHLHFEVRINGNPVNPSPYL